MNYEDFSNEVKKQLNFKNTFRLSTQTELNFKMLECKDKSNYASNWLFKNKKCEQLSQQNTNLPDFIFYLKCINHSPNFQVDVQCQVEFMSSIMLHNILNWLSHHIGNLILDRLHPLLVRNSKLDPARKHILITADIDSMYLELPISACKKTV